MGNIDFSIIDYKALTNGIYLTIIISVISAIFAFIIGSVWTYQRTHNNRTYKWFANLAINCVRNTPLLIIIYLFYNGLPSVGVVLPAILCGIFALSIYTGAYISDAILSGINAVPDEHIQAAAALGLTRLQIYIHIIYPQALRHSIQIIGSQFMNLIKNSSLVSFITVTDVFYFTYKGIADSFRIYEYFILAIIIYCSLTGFTLFLTNTIQKKFRIQTTEVRT